jgi:hypothetical protein
MRRNVICAMLERKISPFGRNDTCDVRVVISKKRSDGEILHDERLRFKLFKPPPRFLPRDAREDEGGGLNGALAVELLEQFEL